MVDKDKVRQIIKDNSRVLMGFAHYDKGVKVDECDCCYCKTRVSICNKMEYTYD